VRDAELMTLNGITSGEFPRFSGGAVSWASRSGVQELYLQPLDKRTRSSAATGCPCAILMPKPFESRLVIASCCPYFRVGCASGSYAPDQLHNKFGSDWAGQRCRARSRFLAALPREQDNGKRQQIAGTELHAAAIETLLNDMRSGKSPSGFAGA